MQPASSIGAMLCGASGLAFAIGVYLPFASMAPLFVGGLCACPGREGHERGEPPKRTGHPGRVGFGRR
jgi:hypothetical protein